MTEGKKNSSPSLSEVHASVDTGKRRGFARTLLAFAGPAYLVSVGYMDPGNWATDIAGGSQFGYTLIWVLLMSNLIALLLQSFSARLGLVRGRDLAQASREVYAPFTNIFLYILAEIAIAATDLAEVLGMAIGLQLLFDLPLLAGVSITVLDSFVLLLLLNLGIRKMEAFIISLVAIIGMAFFAEMFFAKPDIGEVVKGFIPSLPNTTALYIAIGIIGATVMPHNIYLHSALVQTRTFERTSVSIRKAIKFNIIDSAIALNMAFLVNSAILILAASAFYKHGLFEVAEIQDAHKMLEPLLGTQWAPLLFAIALIASGQSSTITGTLAGQVVMEGYLNLRLQPWIRRLLTRLIAIVPAFLTIYYLGEHATGDLLVLSQVILSLQLGFAIIPLIHFVSDENLMGEFTVKLPLQILAWVSALVIVGLNVRLVIGVLREWIANAGDNAWIIQMTVVPLTLFTGFMLLNISLKPFFKKTRMFAEPIPHGGFAQLSFDNQQKFLRIAIAHDFSKAGRHAIEHAIAVGGKEATYLLIHVVESAGAVVFGSMTKDYETESDKKVLEQYADNLKQLGYHCEVTIGYGSPKKTIPEKVNSFNADLLVMGAHGHGGLKDLLFGTTVDTVRHKLNIPVLIVR